jgi:DNA ligase-1
VPSAEGILDWRQSHNFDEVQRSPRCDGGLALRLARVLRIRDDKLVIEVCTLEELRNIYARQMERRSFSDRLAL